METDFWIARWQEGRIGFHEGQPNALLVRFADELKARKRVLVPLCGKSEDLAFLASRGHEVVGVELVEDAVRAFFAEHGIEPFVEPQGALTAWRAGGLTILAGDFFAATQSDVGDVDALYDRAALVALPEAMRARYVSHLRSLLVPASVGLVVTLDYPPHVRSGPPFSVPETELRSLYAGWGVELLAHSEERERFPDTKVSAWRVSSPEI